MSLTLSPYITPNFITYSDSYAPIIPSAAAILKPIGATVIIPQPILPLPSNFDLNKDPRVQKQVVKYFRLKVLEKWIYKDMISLLGYIKVDNTGASIINDMADYREDASSRDSPNDIDKKVHYIGKYVLTEDTMYRILRKFIRGTGANWYDLHKNEFFVKSDIKSQLNNILKDTVAEISSRQQKQAINRIPLQ